MCVHAPEIGGEINRVLESHLLFIVEEFQGGAAACLRNYHLAAGHYHAAEAAKPVAQRTPLRMLFGKDASAFRCVASRNYCTHKSMAHPSPILDEFDFITVIWA